MRQHSGRAGFLTKTALFSAFIFTTGTVLACGHRGGHPHHPPHHKPHHPPHPPKACNIPSNLYSISGQLGQNTRYSMGIYVVGPHAYLMIKDTVLSKNYFVAHKPKHPHKDKCRKGHPWHLTDEGNMPLESPINTAGTDMTPDADSKEFRHGYGRWRHHGHDWKKPHRRPHHGWHRPPHHPPIPACQENELTLKWGEDATVPAMLNGEIKLTYNPETRALNGSVLLNFKNTNGDDVKTEASRFVPRY